MTQLDTVNKSAPYGRINKFDDSGPAATALSIFGLAGLGVRQPVVGSFEYAR